MTQDMFPFGQNDPDELKGHTLAILNGVQQNIMTLLMKIEALEKRVIELEKQNGQSLQRTLGPREF